MMLNKYNFREDAPELLEGMMMGVYLVLSHMHVTGFSSFPCEKWSQPLYFGKQPREFDRKPTILTCGTQVL